MMAQVPEQFKMANMAKEKETEEDKKIAQVKVKSVRKKLKKKDFAAKVNREEIAEGAADLGLEQDELVEHVLGALVPVADDLGL